MLKKAIASTKINKPPATQSGAQTVRVVGSAAKE